MLRYFFVVVVVCIITLTPCILITCLPHNSFLYAQLATILLVTSPSLPACLVYSKFLYISLRPTVTPPCM